VLACQSSDVKASKGRERRLMGVPVVHFEIMGGQGNQIEKFYGERFGWKINSNNAKK